MTRPLARPPRRHLAALFTLAVGAVSPQQATAAPTAVEPLAGLWLGAAGTARERVEVGIELRPGAAGGLTLALTLPVANYFAVELPGEVRNENGVLRYDSAEFGLSLSVALRGDRLEGTFPDAQTPASFARVAALPAESAPPELPALPAARWQKRLGGQIFASPVVFDGVVYVGTTGGVMNAFRAVDGKFLWAFPAGRPIFGAALATAEAVYFVCDDGRLYKLARSDGQQLWRYELGDERASRVLPHPALFDWDWQGPTPALADGTLYVGAGDGGFHAVDAATGEGRWRFAAGGRIRNGAAIDGPRVVFGSADRHVYALDRASGAPVWSHATDGEIDTAPVVHDGKVIVGNRGGGLFALAATSGERLWKSSFWTSWVESTPVVVDGTLYVGASDLRRVSALDPADGRVIWRSDVYGWSWGTPLVVGDRVYAGAAGGKPYLFRHVAGLAELDRASGRLLRRTPWPEAAGGHQWGFGGSLALAGDTLVATTLDGSVFGIPLD